MSYLKTNHDELLDGFCRGCLKKYEDPANLLHYTEKNRRLFVYSTGIQVKRNDTFTFQICKECYVNMKISCKFKKQCRSSERTFKNFLRMKELGDGPDLLTFLRNYNDNLKFPLLSGNSTPATQKNRDDDNESTCTSIRNFMTDILQGEEMPDSEARIIEEVIEEEADLLDDSLDSHWLLDDSIDIDSRLDFSFSPFATPRSTNNDNYSPIKQLEPSLHCKNNHVKKVFQQLPTLHTSDDNSVKILQNKSILQNDSKQKTQTDQFGMKFTADDSIAELINQNEDFILSQRDNNDVNTFQINSAEVTSNLFHPIKKEAAKSFDLNANTESQDSKKKYLTENEIAVKSITLGLDTQENLNKTSFHTEADSLNLNALEIESQFSKGNLTENDLAVKSIMQEKRSKTYSPGKIIDEFEPELHVNRNKMDVDEVNIAVKSIMMNSSGKKSEINSWESPITQEKNDVTINSISLSDIKTEYNEDINSHSVTKNFTVNTVTTAEMKTKDSNKLFPMSENELAVQSIMDIVPNDNNMSVTILKYESIAEPMDSEIRNVHGRNKFPLTVTDLEGKFVETKIYKSQCQGDSNKIDYVMTDVLEKSQALEKNYEDTAATIHENHENISLCGDILVENQVDTVLVKNEDDHITIDIIDHNLEEALKDDSNQNISLDDVLDSPGRVYARGKGRVTGISTPTINNILFGEKLEDSNQETNLNTLINQETQSKDKNKEIDGEVDVLEEFFKEGVKEFEGKEYNPELPLELKYDLQSCTCKMCNKTFSSLKALKIHLSRIHLIKFPRRKHEAHSIVCNLCGMLVTDNRNYARHLKMHKIDEEKTFKCDICMLTFSTRFNLKQHIMNVHQSGGNLEKKNLDDKAKKLICNVCGDSFKARYFSVHMRRHTTNYFYTCNICGKGFHRFGELKRHHVTVHSKLRPFECKLCGKTYTSKHNLVYHMASHTEKQFECDYCTKRYSTKKQIEHHILHSKYCKRKREKTAKIVDKKRFKCANCPLKFANKYSLVKHQNWTACGKKDFSDVEDENTSSSVKNVTLIFYDNGVPMNVTISNEASQNVIVKNEP